ncbi:SGNH/GDSL hydrolase family protein [Fodinicola feengrottensis]|uniref:SGNH/GDSL hydrolase family protein n=1 Tax=Fodinicola feengrottensis TaxID=435914 RepID=A0ABP4SAV6_9ACTN
MATSAAPLNYVNMGDSYSAGSGVLPLASGITPLCAQSSRNWAHDLATTAGFRLTDVSCGGAQTSHYTNAQYPGTPPQLDALSSATQLVTMTIGGNDENTFISAIVACGSAGVLTGGQGSPCKNAYGDMFANTINNKVYPNIVKALQAVKTKAPNARVLIAGYLSILPPTNGCFPSIPIATGDVPYLGGIQATLNGAVKRAAAATGATYVDLTAISQGHDACQPTKNRWVEPLFGANGLSIVHPNATGEQAMAQQTLATL